MIVSEGTLEALEFSQVREQVAQYSRTAEGADLLRQMVPWSEEAVIAKEAQRVGDLMFLLQQGVQQPTTQLPPVGEILRRNFPKHTMLSGEDLAAVRSLLLLVQELTQFLSSEDSLPPSLKDPQTQLLPGRGMMKDLIRFLREDGTLNLEIIPEIQTVQRSLQRLNGERNAQAEEIMRQKREMFRQDHPTLRDHRVVLPLVANFRGRVDGIVHHSSQSGETLYVEPKELMELNNRIAQEEAEIHRIVTEYMRRFSGEVREEIETLRRLFATVIELDLSLSKARYGSATRGILVPVSSRVQLNTMRHPLLGQKCVPLTIQWRDTTSMIVVSGPNTGGKTVLLKTVGLAALMRQCAIPLSAAPGTGMPTYKHVAVDIGDSQSIFDALSTFSGHLKNLVEVTETAQRESLILLDELGSGTDPEEGTALAMAVVDHLIAVGSTVLITTHQSVLKHYGYTREGAENASMEFDTERGVPTFRVLVGHPGASYALESAQRLGLAAPILERAHQYHQDGSDSVASIVSQLMTKERELEAERANLEDAQRRIAQEQEEVEALRARLIQREQELRKQGIQEMRKELKEARKEIEAGIRRLRERSEELDRDTIHDIRRSTDPLETLLNATEQEFARESVPPAPPPRPLPDEVDPGTAVEHVATGRSGVVIQDRRSVVEVQFASLRMKVKRRELQLTSEAAAQSPRVKTQATASMEWKTGAVPMQLDLRGLRREEALRQLEEYLDRAVMSGVSGVAIVHGTGTGVLQEGVQQYLRDRREVVSFHFSHPEEGGFGRTEVELQGR